MEISNSKKIDYELIKRIQNPKTREEENDALIKLVEKYKPYKVGKMKGYYNILGVDQVNINFYLTVYEAAKKFDIKTGFDFITLLNIYTKKQWSHMVEEIYEMRAYDYWGCRNLEKVAQENNVEVEYVINNKEKYELTYDAKFITHKKYNIFLNKKNKVNEQILINTIVDDRQPKQVEQELIEEENEREITKDIKKIIEILETLGEEIKIDILKNRLYTAKQITLKEIAKKNKVTLETVRNQEKELLRMLKKGEFVNFKKYL